MSLRDQLQGLAFVVLLLFLPLEAGAVELVYNSESDREPFAAYTKELIALAFASQGSVYQLTPSARKVPQKRALVEMRAGRGIDIYWTMTSADRERGLRVIRIPILKGMLGNRLMVVRVSDERFDAVNSLEQLSAYQLGQGHDWPDADILEQNGLSVFRSPNYADLMELMVKGRFDAFPLGVNEIWQEVSSRRHLPVKIHKKILLSYSAPVFIFFPQNAGSVADTLELGLEYLIQSGELDRLFYKHFGSYLEQASIDKKRTFRLINQGLSYSTLDALKKYQEFMLVH